MRSWCCGRTGMNEVRQQSRAELDDDSPCSREAALIGSFPIAPTTCAIPGGVETWLGISALVGSASARPSGFAGGFVGISHIGLYSPPPVAPVVAFFPHLGAAGDD